MYSSQQLGEQLAASANPSASLREAARREYVRWGSLLLQEAAEKKPDPKALLNYLGTLKNLAPHIDKENDALIKSAHAALDRGESVKLRTLSQTLTKSLHKMKRNSVLLR